MLKNISKEAKDQATNFEKTEKVAAGRFLIRLTKMLDEEKYVSGRNLYAYIRYLDDIVDEGQDVSQVMQLLKNERVFLQEVLDANDASEVIFNNHQQELVIQALSGNKNKNRIVEYLLSGLKAFYLDAIAIKYSRPLPKFAQDERDSLSLLPYLEILSVILFDVGFSGDESQGAFAELMSVWAKYDALRDYEEDLSAGLVIFSRKELAEFGLNLQTGQIVPEEFNELHRQLKPRTIKRILKNLRTINKSEIPVIVQMAFQAYFLVAVVKLVLTKSMGDKDIVFSSNHKK